MSPRRRAPLATLYARVDARMRATVALTIALSAAGKLLTVVLAMRIAEADVRGASTVGAVGVFVLALHRIVANSARVNAECDLQRALSRAVLESDVLVPPTAHPLRALAEATHHARALIAETVPELAASTIAALTVLPVLSRTLSPRALVVGGIAMSVVVLVLVALRRTSTGLQERVWDAQAEVLDRVSTAVEGRLELVARGAEGEALRLLEQTIDRYRVAARRGAWGAAMLGRAPLAAGLVAVLVVVVLDASFRQAVTTAVIAQALVIAACLPILLGVILRANELVRLSAMVGPVLEVLAAPRRAELSRGGKPPPALPAVIAFHDVTFAYEPESPPTLRALSFEWPAGGALLIEGPNGAGKSTLLRVLLGLRSPRAGSVSVGGINLATLDLPLFRRSVSYLPQRPYLGEVHATVRAAMRGGVDDVVADATMREGLERVGLGAAARVGDILDAAVGELSAGQRQRLALARILLQDASIYLLDEPDANLDRAGVALVGDIVRELLARGRMVAIAAHTDALASLPGTRLTLDLPPAERGG